MTSSSAAYPCPACGFVVFCDPPGSYDTCVFCGWEDDAVQLAHPALAGGANAASLVEAQVVALGTHPLTVTELDGAHRDPAWRPYDPELDAESSPVPRTGEAYFSEAAEAAPLYYWRRSRSGGG